MAEVSRSTSPSCPIPESSGQTASTATLAAAPMRIAMQIKYSHNSKAIGAASGP